MDKLLERRFPGVTVSHKGVLSLLQYPPTGRLEHVVRGNHSMLIGVVGGKHCRSYYYFGNCILSENTDDKTYHINPRFANYSVSTKRALGAYRAFYAMATVGFTESKEPWVEY